jgi:hypothetical protein
VEPHTQRMADQYEHHGLSGEYVMLPSGELVPAAEAKKAKPAPQAAKPAPQPAKPAPKGQN